MGIPGKPNYYGRQLVRKLKEERERAGLTQEEAGDNLHMKLQKLSRIENGQLPGYHELRAMLDLYDVPPAEQDLFKNLWERARERGWWKKYGLEEENTYVAMEHEAALALEFHVGLVPELLQTKDYARACVGGDENQVTVRMKRQYRVAGGVNPLVLHSLIYEPVLRQGLDEEQTALLVERARLRNVTIQIVPQSLGPLPAMTGSVVLFDFDDQEEPRIAFSRTPLGLTYSQDEYVTETVHSDLRDLAKRSMSPVDSLVLLRQLATN